MYVSYKHTCIIAAASLLCLNAMRAGPLLAADNLARGHACTFAVPPNYSLCSDPADHLQLTDGVKLGADWIKKSTVGWMTIPLIPAVTIDLQAHCAIDEVRLHTVSGGSSVRYPSYAAVLVSDDGADFRLAKAVRLDQLDHPVWSPTEKVPFIFTVSNVQACARYIKVVLRQGSSLAMFLDELEVIGTANTSAPPYREPDTLPQCVGEKELDAWVEANQLFADKLRVTRETLLQNDTRFTQNTMTQLLDQMDDLASLIANAATGLAPLDQLHNADAALQRLRGQIYQTLYGTPFVSLPANPLEVLSEAQMLVAPAEATMNLDIDLWRREKGAVAFNVINCQQVPMDLRLEVLPTSSLGAFGLSDVMTARCAAYVKAAWVGSIADALLPLDGRDLEIPPGGVQQIWLDLHDPGLSPAQYSFNINLQARTGQDVIANQQASLTLRIHDLTLDPTLINSCTWSYVPYRIRPQAATEFVIEDLKQHHTNVFVVHHDYLPWPAYVTADGQLGTIDYSAFDGWLALHRPCRLLLWFHWKPALRDSGRFGDWMSDAWQTAFSNWLAQVVAHLHEQGFDYDDFALYPFDETLCDDFYQLAQLAKQVDPQVKIYANSFGQGPQEFERFRNLIDIWCLADVYSDRYPDWLATIRSWHKELWTYDAKGPGKAQPPNAYYRLMSWRAFARGQKGVGFYSHTDLGPQWNDTGNPIGAYGTLYPCPDGYDASEPFFPSRRWQAYRDGIEDFIYLQSLDKCLEDMALTTPQQAALLRSRMDALVTQTIQNPDDLNLVNQVRTELTDLMKAAAPVATEPPDDPDPQPPTPPDDDPLDGPANQPPLVETIPNQVVDENDTLLFTVLANDPDGDTLQYSAQGLPQDANLTGPTFSWTPDYQAAGDYTVQLVVSDGTHQVSQNLLITVRNINRAPQITTIPNRNVRPNETVTFDVSANDPDGDPFTLTATNLPANATFTQGVFSWTPSYALPLGDYTIRFVASDTTTQTQSTVILMLAEDLVDNTPPLLTRVLPQGDAIQTPRNGLVMATISDAGTGVDAASVTLHLNDVQIYHGDNTTCQTPLGICRRIGTKEDFTYTFQPNAVFDYDQTLRLRLAARDLAGNAMNANEQQFTTQMVGFSPPQTLTPDAPTQHPPVASCDPTGQLALAWAQGPEGTRQIHFTRTDTPTGPSQTPVCIAPDGNDQAQPALALGPNGTIYVAWQQFDGTHWRIVAAYSDQGMSWTKPVNLTGDTYDARQPAIAVDQMGLVYVAWQDNRQAATGNTWAVQLVQLNRKLTNPCQIQRPPITADQTEPALAVANDGRVYVLWTDARNDNGDLYLACNRDNWQERLLLAAPARQGAARLLADQDDTLHVVYEDYSTGNADIAYASASCDLTEIPLTGQSLVDDTTDAPQTRPQAVLAAGPDANRLFVCWQDERNSNQTTDTDIYLTQIRPAGARTNVLVSASADQAIQTSPALAVNTRGEPVVFWLEPDQNSPEPTSRIRWAATASIEGQQLAHATINAAQGGCVGTTPDQARSLDDVSIQVPPRAIWTDLCLSITRLDTPAPLLEPQTILASYEFGPSSTVEFSEPVIVTIPFAVPAAQGSTTVKWYNPQTGSYSQSGISNMVCLDLAPGLAAIQFQTTHFSQYALIQQPAPGSADHTTSSSGHSGGCAMAPGPARPQQVLAWALPYLMLFLGWCLHRRRLSPPR